MTTREQIIAKAVECFHPYSEWQIDIERFYAIAFEAGRVAEREACAVIAETPVYGEQDDITMEAKDRIAKVIRERSTK